MAVAFCTAFIALWVGHYVADHWVQSGPQARDKGLPGWSGRLAAARHVATLTATKIAVLGVTFTALGLHIVLPFLVVAVVVDAGAHYWADRRTTLARLADRLAHGDFYRMGQPPLATGAYVLDQAWHLAWVGWPP